MLQNYGKLENMEGNGGQGPENQDIKSDPIEITEMPSSSWREKTQEEVDEEVKRIEDKTSNPSLPEGYDIDPSNPNYMINKKTGKKFPRIIGGGSGSIPTPEATDTANEDALRRWLEGYLRKFESSDDQLIENQTIRDMLETIARVRNHAITKEIKEKMITTMMARIKYHNVNIKSKTNIKDYGDEFKNITKEEHTVILLDPYVKFAALELIKDDGAYFRLGNDEAKTRRVEIKASLVALGRADADADKDLELALKTANIWGSSASYDGIVDKSGKLINPKGPHAVRQMVTYVEENWTSINFKGSLNGQGAKAIRDVLFNPVRLGKDDKDSAGRAKGLKRFTSIWVDTGARLDLPKGSPDDTPLPDYFTLEEVLTKGTNADEIDKYRKKVAAWAGSLNKISDNKDQFQGKGSKSILHLPFIDANFVNMDNVSSKVPSVMKNYEEAIAAYSHLGFDQQLQAKAHLLKGMLWYLNSDESRKDGFFYEKWNGAMQNQVLIWAVRSGHIDENWANWVRGELGISTGSVVSDIGKHELGKGVGGYLAGIFKAVTGGGGGGGRR